MLRHLSIFHLCECTFNAPNFTKDLMIVSSPIHPTTIDANSTLSRGIFRQIRATSNGVAPRWRSGQPTDTRGSYTIRGVQRLAVCRTFPDGTLVACRRSRSSQMSATALYVRLGCNDVPIVDPSRACTIVVLACANIIAIRVCTTLIEHQRWSHRVHCINKSDAIPMSFVSRHRRMSYVVCDKSGGLYGVMVGYVLDHPARCQ